MGNQKKASEFAKGDKVWVSRHRECRATVMGVIGSYAMLRFSGCTPFVEFVGDLRAWNPAVPPEPQAPSAPSTEETKEG